MVTVANPLASTALYIDASADTDSHAAVLDGASPAELTGVVPANIFYTASQVSGVSLDFRQRIPSGSNNLTVDFSTGNPLPSSGLDPGIPFGSGFAYNAGTGADNTLNLEGTLPGGGFALEVHNANDPNVGGASQYGSIMFTDQSSNTSELTYSGLSPINDTVPVTNYTFNDLASDESFIVQNGPTVSGYSTLQFVNTPAVPPPTFETTNIANKTNVVLAAAGAASVVNGTVNITAASTGLATLGFYLPTGQDNQVAFVNTPPGVVTSYIGSSAADITSVSGLGVAAGTTLGLNGAAGDNTLNYDAGGEIPTIAPGLLPSEVLISIPGAGIVDAINYQQVNITDLPPIVITPGPAVAINGVENVPLVNQTVATFTAPIVTPLAPAGFPASNFTASIDWGDPSPDTSAGTVTQDATNPSIYDISGTHTFLSNGTYTVASTVAFSGGSYSVVVNGVTFTGTFGPSGPTAGTSATATVIQGSLIVSAFPIVGSAGIPIAAAPIATFVDNGGADPIASYSATIKITNSAGVVVVSVPAASITQNGNAASYTVNAPALTLPDPGVYQVLVWSPTSQVQRRSRSPAPPRPSSRLRFRF